MLVKQEFKVDLVDLKNAAFPEKVLEAIQDRRAEELGTTLVKLFPYKKNEEASYHGTLPEMVLNREHQFVDRYEQRLYILTEEQASELLSLIRRSNLSHDQIQQAKTLLS